MSRNPTGLSFALPPSMGRASLLPVARHLADLISSYGFTTVWPQPSYAALERVLNTGQAHAAWAPPTICARVQRAGGATILRAVRMGSSSYRSALLCRGERSIDLKSLHMRAGHKPLRAAWVDPDSAAGYLMPRRYLRGRGAVLEEILSEKFLGSFRACFDAVIEGDADLTASYVGRRGSGYIDLCGNHAAELRVLAWTDEIPNDGVVVSPALSDERRAEVTAAINAAFGDAATAQQVALALDADGFEAPDPCSYDSMLDLLTEADRPVSADALTSVAGYVQDAPRNSSSVTAARDSSSSSSRGASMFVVAPLM